MTGLYVVAIAALAALGFGLYRKLVDGRVIAPARSTANVGLDAGRLGSELGGEATFVQFSSAVCAPCRATGRLLSAVVAAQPGVAHIDLDVEAHFHLASELGITRTPTVLLLDADGVVRRQIVGSPRRTEVLQALTELGGRGTQLADTDDKRNSL